MNYFNRQKAETKRLKAQIRAKRGWITRKAGGTSGWKKTSSASDEAIAREAAEEVAKTCALHMPYIRPRETGKAAAIILSAIRKAKQAF